MLMKIECITCILNQVIRIIDHLDIDKKKRDEIFKGALELSSHLDHSLFLPPLYSEKFYDLVAGYTGETDPYKMIRKAQNDLILKNSSFFEKQINESQDPLFTSLYYSLLGNVIDYGGVEIFKFNELFGENGQKVLAVNDYDKLYSNLKGAKSVLVVADNAGEAVFDKMFLEQIINVNPRIEIFYGVRSGPAINDVMIEDALYIGIDKFAKVIETGSTYAGTFIPDSLREFNTQFYKSDIVISKGQGNFETLEFERGRDIFFVFKVKCKVVSEFTGLEHGSLVMGYRNSFPDFE